MAASYYRSMLFFLCCCRLALTFQASEQGISLEKSKPAFSFLSPKADECRN